MTQKPHDGRTIESCVLHLYVQLALGCDGANGRQMVARQRNMQHRRLSARRIRTHGHRQQIEPGFVYEHDGTSFPVGFFLMASQVSARHCSIAASWRWVARSRGFWRLHFICLSSRPTCRGWYDTPNSRLMSAATRGWVQTSPRNPQCSAPWANRSGNVASCSFLKRGLGPPPFRCRNAPSPSVRARLTHWLTAPALTPSASAMSFCCQPFWWSSHARNRRASRQSFGRFFAVLSMRQSLPLFAPF